MENEDVEEKLNFANVVDGKEIEATEEQKDIGKMLKGIAKHCDSPLAICFILTGDGTMQAGVYSEHKVVGQIAVDTINETAQYLHHAIDKNPALKILLNALYKKPDDAQVDEEWAEEIEEK